MLLALFGILILVIVWPVGSKSKEADNQVSESVAGTEKRTYNYAEQYTANMELRLKEILENVDGAGAVQVMITVKNNGEQVVEKDKSYSESKTIQSGDGGKIQQRPIPAGQNQQFMIGRTAAVHMWSSSWNRR